jgi:hypothetical protein
VTEDGHAASLDDLRPDDASHQRRLSASGRPEHTGDGAAGELDRDALQCDASAADDSQIANVDCEVAASPN